MVVHGHVSIETQQTGQWLLLVGKELFIGIAIGVFFGIFIWAFEAAGAVIDTQIGSSIATIFDPISGHEITLIGELLAKWSIYVFVSSGGLLLFAIAILESYQSWPIEQLPPNLPAAAASLFTSEFTRFMTLTLMIAAPIMIVVFLVDVSMGCLLYTSPSPRD